jgi:hypothetical protein
MQTTVVFVGSQDDHKFGPFIAVPMRAKLGLVGVSKGNGIFEGKWQTLQKRWKNDAINDARADGNLPLQPKGQTQSCQALLLE